MKPEIGIENTQDGQPEGEVKGKAEKKAGKRIGYNYIIIKSLKESKKNDVVKCLYIKSLTKWGFCVIKEGTYGDTKDKHGRDIKDRLVWQKELHELLQNKVRMPKLLGTFEENGNYYLVMEFMKGRSLGSLVKRKGKLFHKTLSEGKKSSIKFLDYLVQIATILDTFHQQSIVHRDVTAANFVITRSGKVAVIDMELSFSLAKKMPDPPFQLGTYGFMSPQQEATLEPTIQEDIFSIGAILLMVWTGISPNKMTNCSPAELEEKSRFFIPDKQIAEITKKCLQPEPADRPSLSEVKDALLNYRSDLLARRPRPQNERIYLQKEAFVDAIQQTVSALGTSLFADPEKGWFSENSKDPSLERNTINKTWYASFYNGSAGVIYLMSRLKSAGINVASITPSVLCGLELIQKKYIQLEEERSSSLYYGSSGIAEALIAALENNLIEHDEKYWDWIDTLLETKSNYFGIIQGVAGHCLSMLSYMKKTGKTNFEFQLRASMEQLISNQETNGSWQVFPGNKENARVIPGFGHGVAGIVFALLELGQHFQDQAAFSAAEHGLNWLMNKSIRQKGKFRWTSSSGKEIGPWWCEGTAGIALAFLKAWSYLPNPVYKEFAVGALRTQPFEVFDYNLSQCHGLSGLGEIYLEAYAVLQEEEWLHRANWIAQVLMRLKRKHHRHGVHWLVEGERHPTAGFMTGNGGILHFLLRTCYSDTIGMPLLGEVNSARPIARVQAASYSSILKVGEV